MNLNTILAIVSLATGAVVEAGAASGADRNALTFPQKRAASYEEMLKYQALGRFVVPPDGSFFMFEWSRPYDWAPNHSGLGHAASKRMQTFLYRVETPDEWIPTKPPISRELLPRAPGASYYLGSLSPNGRLVSFYELDRDDAEVRAGVAEATGAVPPKIVWFDVTPDVRRLDQPAVWVTNDQLVFPVTKGTSRLAKAMVSTGKTVLCEDCDRDLLHRASASPGLTVSAEIHPAEDVDDEPIIPEGARLSARSSDGRLAVYTIDNKNVLTLLFMKNSQLVTLLENARTTRGVEDLR